MDPFFNGTGKTGTGLTVSCLHVKMYPSRSTFYPSRSIFFSRVNGSLVYLRPCPAAGHIATALRKIVVPEY